MPWLLRCVHTLCLLTCFEAPNLLSSHSLHFRSFFFETFMWNLSAIGCPWLQSSSKAGADNSRCLPAIECPSRSGSWSPAVAFFLPSHPRGPSQYLPSEYIPFAVSILNVFGVVSFVWLCFLPTPGARGQGTAAQVTAQLQVELQVEREVLGIRLVFVAPVQAALLQTPVLLPVVLLPLPHGAECPMNCFQETVRASSGQAEWRAHRAPTQPGQAMHKLVLVRCQYILVGTDLNTLGTGMMSARVGHVLSIRKGSRTPTCVPTRVPLRGGLRIEIRASQRAA